MEKRKLNRITAGFIVLVVMVLILMFSNSLRRSSISRCRRRGAPPDRQRMIPMPPAVTP